jgi:hypothetical protein
VVGLVALAALAVTGVVVVRHSTQHIKSQVSDGVQCAKAAASLQVVTVPDPFHPPIFQMRTSHTTAALVATEMSNVHGDPHPWDQESSNTRVVRCESGTVTWFVDAHGHAARLPGT